MLIQRANEHDAPEMIDRRRCLLLLLQPIEHRRAVRDLWTAATADDAQHRARDRIFVLKRQKRECGERWNQMERRRQPGRLDPPAASLRIREKQLVVITNLVRNAGPAKKVFQIRTAAECHMLAIVDVFTRGKTIRRRTATKPWIFLQE